MTTTEHPPAGAAPPATLLPTLPGSYYTDPDVFAREQTRVFESMWCCAVRSAELADPGSFRRVQVGRESVLVVQGRDGELRAFHNVCRHRGALLCTEESGQTKRTLRCTYHAWSYGLDGTLIGAPNLRNMPDVDQVAHGLVPVQLREWLGYAWVCLADEPPSFEGEVQRAVTERLGDPAAIEGYDVERLIPGWRIRYDVRAN